jgi:hypothetical protein
MPGLEGIGNGDGDGGEAADGAVGTTGTNVGEGAEAVGVEDGLTGLTGFVCGAVATVGTELSIGEGAGVATEGSPPRLGGGRWEDVKITNATAASKPTTAVTRRMPCLSP